MFPMVDGTNKATHYRRIVDEGLEVWSEWPIVICYMGLINCKKLLEIGRRLCSLVDDSTMSL